MIVRRPLPVSARAALALVALVAVAPVPAATAQTQPAAPATTVRIGPQVESFKLDNGLEVVVIPDRRAPVVTHMIWYKVGAADEPPGKSGIAHYLEHLMFKGTKANPDGAFSAKVAEIGGQENAFTSSDYTAYFQRVAKEHLALVMELEADRMQNLVLTEATAKPELQVVLEERSSRTDNDPSALLSEAMDAALHIAHPYRIPVIGWRHEIEKLTYRDALDFYGRFYTPNNAVLVIAGDVTVAEVRKFAADTYAKVPRRFDVPPRVRPRDPEPVALREVRLADPRVNQPSVRLGWVVPSYTTAEKGKSEAEALDVGLEILGGGSTSRLYRALVVEKKLAASAGGWYGSTALDDTQVMLYATPRDGVDVAKLRQAMEEVVAEFAAKGPSEEELARAKTATIAETIYAQDSQQSLARIFGTALTTGATIEDVQTWPSRIKAVTTAEVKAAAARWLERDRSVAAFLVTAPGAKPRGGGGEAGPPAGGGPIRAVDDRGFDDGAGRATETETTR